MQSGRLLTPKQIRQRKEELRKDYGDKCHIALRCKHIPGPDYRTRTGQDLMLDHKDNNAKNNDPSNHQLACRACNGAKNPRGKTRFDRHKTLIQRTKRILRVRVREDTSTRTEAMGEDRERKMLGMLLKGLSYEQAKNLKGRPLFDKWLRDKIGKYSYWPFQDVINAGAVIADVEITATERWLKRDISSEGSYDTDTIEGGVVVVKFKGAKLNGNSMGPT